MPKVPYEEFKRQFAENLEITDIDSLDFPLAEIKEFDSMGKLVISVLVEDLFGIYIEYEILESQTSLHDLYAFCLLTSSSDQTKEI